MTAFICSGFGCLFIGGIVALPLYIAFGGERGRWRK